MESLPTASENVNECNHYRNHCGGFSEEKLTLDLPCDPATVPLDVHPKDSTLTCHRDTCTSVFTVVLFTIAKE